MNGYFGVLLVCGFVYVGKLKVGVKVSLAYFESAERIICLFVSSIR